MDTTNIVLTLQSRTLTYCSGETRCFPLLKWRPDLSLLAINEQKAWSTLDKLPCQHTKRTALNWHCYIFFLQIPGSSLLLLFLQNFRLQRILNSIWRVIILTHLPFRATGPRVQRGEGTTWTSICWINVLFPRQRKNPSRWPTQLFIDFSTWIIETYQDIYPERFPGQDSILQPSWWEETVRHCAIKSWNHLFFICTVIRFVGLPQTRPSGIAFFTCKHLINFHKLLFDDLIENNNNKKGFYF